MLSYDYDNVVAGRLKLKGKALDVTAGGIRKKNKQKKQFDQICDPSGSDHSTGKSLSVDHGDDLNEAVDDGSGSSNYDDHLTPAKRRFLEQTEKLDSEIG